VGKMVGEGAIAPSLNFSLSKNYVPVGMFSSKKIQYNIGAGNPALGGDLVTELKV